MTPLRDHTHLVPLFGSLIWFLTLWALLGTWLGQGRPHYVSQEGSIAYISDVGADILKPLFIVGSSITAITLIFSLSIERWFRHRGRLLPNQRTREKVLSSLAIAGSVLGGAGLILLSIFDTKRHTKLHRLFLLLFIVGVSFSALFTVAEFAWLRREYQYHNQLRRAYILKGTIVLILIAASIAFGVCLDVKANAGAVLEWFIAFGFTSYLLTFWSDLRRAKGVQPGELHDPRRQMESAM